MIKGQLISLFRLFFLMIRYNLDEFFLQTRWGRKFYFLHYLNPFYLLSNRHIAREKRLVMALQKAGPMFVKFGQLLSTRSDILPKNMIEALSSLQDQVNPCSEKIAKKIILGDEGEAFQKNFSHIEFKAFACASIAEVHAATLISGEEVVIKILRPHIRQHIARDCALLYFFAKFFKPHGHRLAKEIETSLQNEINLIHEAAHATQLKENIKSKHEQIYIPNIYWEYSTENRLVMERVHGISLKDKDALKQHGVDGHQLAKQCVEVFFKQIFVDNYFHADLHPGNIFIQTADKEKPVIALVDFGIVGSLSLKDRRYIAENILALIAKDYRKVARLHHESQWIPAHISEIAFAYAMKKVCDPILNKALKDISLAQLLMGLLKTAKDYDIQLQPQLLLLQKTLLNIESLCRDLDANINLWDTMQPILNAWLKSQLSPILKFKILIEHLSHWIRQLDD